MHPLYQALLADARFHELLLTFDRDLRDCRTSGEMRAVRRHTAFRPLPPQAPWPSGRAGRGARLAFSFCCAVDGCRKRTTPPSLRFLGRKVYLAAMVVLIAIMRQGATAAAYGSCPRWLASTAGRSSAGGHGGAAASHRARSGRSARAAFMPPVDRDRLPASLLERFSGDAAANELTDRAAAFPRPDHRRRQARSLTAFPDPQRMPVASRWAFYRPCTLIQRSAGMSQQNRGPRVHERWAHLRFSVIGQLLAAPPPKGELRAAIEALAARQWRHPITGEPARFGFSTIERWYYRALKERSDPVGVLRRKVRGDAGQQVAMSDPVRQAVLAQYAAHKSWSVQLHHDNLAALAETRPDLKPVPSYYHAAPLLQGERSRPAPARHFAPDARRGTRRSAACRSRGAQLRGRVCQRPVALGLPLRLQEGADGARRVAHSRPVRRA